MRLGVVFSGAGVHGAAGIGVLQALHERGFAPYAAAGICAGAWPAALHAAGLTPQQMEDACWQAQRMGARLLGGGAFSGALLRGKRQALCQGRGIFALLGVQTGGRILALCPGKAVFPLRMARTGQMLLLASHAIEHENGALFTMQASAGFAARACMGTPPLIEPLSWMGSPLLPLCDVRFAAEILFLMGAQRVLIVEPKGSPRRDMDALEMLCAGMTPQQDTMPGGTAVLRVNLPDEARALSVSQIVRCMDAGKKAAERELDRAFEAMGMAFCRVLPFTARR